MDYSVKPPKCSDNKIPACSDGKQPTTCADGSAAIQQEQKVTKEVGPKACSDGKTPTCKD